MSENSITIAEYKAMQKKESKSKYKNKICRTGDSLDMKMDSLGELAYYNFLKTLAKSGDILYFNTQVPIRLPGNTKYVVDFQVFYPDGSVAYFDFKGCVTDMFRLKRRQVEALYPIKIRCIFRRGKRFFEKELK